jgi:hypothetical protein
MESFFTLEPGATLLDIRKTAPVLFRTANEFSMHITNSAHEQGKTLTQCLLDYIEDRDVEPEEVAKLVSKSLKELLALEMQEAGLLARESSAAALE